jgi:hypothetical protein
MAIGATKYRRLWQALGTILVFATWPFLSFLAHNIDESDYYHRIALAWIIFAGFCCSLVLLSSLVLKGERVLSMGIRLEETWIAIWIAISLLVAAMVWRLTRRPGWRRAMMAAVVVMMVLPLAEIVLYALSSEDLRVTGPPPTAAENAKVSTERNVYWIITDAYARGDVLQAYYGWDNTPFLTALRERGFVIGERSSANYPWTKYSVSSTLQMEYFSPLSRKPRHRTYKPALRGFNNTVARFKSLGYHYIHGEPGGGILKTLCGGQEDRCITGEFGGGISLTEAEVELLRLTPFFHLVRRWGSDLFRFEFNEATQLIDQLRIEEETPFFLFYHILLPHPPVRFEADCSPAQIPDWNLLGWDRDGYLTNIKCLNEQLIDVLDAILRDDATDPIIIISADHGNTFEKPIRESENGAIDPDALRIVYSVLLAMRLPEGECRDSVYPTISSVNQFRLVFACLTDVKPDFLPDRHFLPLSDQIREIELPEPLSG